MREKLAEGLARPGLGVKQAASAIKNWQKGLFKPNPRRQDVEKLADVLGVDANELNVWKASYRYAPISPHKARLVTQLIMGRNVQNALDILQFTHKRAASMVSKVLKLLFIHK